MPTSEVQDRPKVKVSLKRTFAQENVQLMHALFQQNCSLKKKKLTENMFLHENTYWSSTCKTCALKAHLSLKMVYLMLHMVTGGYP